MAARLLLLFIILPIIELWLLIQVGQAIGVLATLALVVLTAVVGSQLVRRQGLGAIARIREAQARGEPPALPLLDGAALLLAGFMLLTPGFISDALGFSLLIPGLREHIARRLLSRVVIFGPGGPANGGRPRPHRRRDGDAIEGEFRRETERSKEEIDSISRRRD